MGKRVDVYPETLSCLIKLLIATGLMSVFHGVARAQGATGAVRAEEDE